ncbi:hypothetical protein D3C78_1892470 [compost metagenome]
MNAPKEYAGHLTYTDEYCLVVKADEYNVYVNHLEEIIEGLEWSNKGVAEWRDLYYQERAKRAK